MVPLCDILFNVYPGCKKDCPKFIQYIMVKIFFYNTIFVCSLLLRKIFLKSQSETILFQCFYRQKLNLYIFLFVVGGFFSVVYSDIFQTILLSFASVYIAVVAFIKVDPDTFRRAVGDSWFNIKPVWELPNPPVEYSDLFGLLVLLWLSKGIIGLFTSGGGSPGAEFQRLRAARNEAEASKILVLPSAKDEEEMDEDDT